MNVKLSETARDWTLMQKNLVCFGVADGFSTVIRLPFEVRKQLLQMNDKDIGLKKMFNAMRRSLFPCFIRDIVFRTSYLILHDVFLIKNYYYYKIFGNMDQEQRTMLRATKADYQKKITSGDK